jgi:hypothetical protein
MATPACGAPHYLYLTEASDSSLQITRYNPAAFKAQMEFAREGLSK